LGRERPTPERAIENVKRDVETVKKNPLRTANGGTTSAGSLSRDEQRPGMDQLQAEIDQTRIELARPSKP